LEPHRVRAVSGDRRASQKASKPRESREMSPAKRLQSLAATPRGGTVELSAPRSGLRAWVRGWGGRLGLGGLMVTGLVISMSADQTAVLLPKSLQLGYPSWLGGVFGGHGVDLGLGGMIAVCVLMFVSYAIVMRATGQLSAKAVLIGIAALHALVLLAPPLLSTDVFSYIAYGRIERLYHANPYLFGPSAIRLDSVYPYIASEWVYTPTDYGPLFTALSYLLAPLTIAANVIGYKAIAGLSSLVIVWVVWKAAALRGVDQVKAVALVGLNPVMIVYGVGGGHNDMLMLAMLVLGLYVLLMQRERTGGALIVAATAIKLTGGLVLPFAVADRSRAGAGSRGRRAVLTGVVLAGLPAAALSFGLFGTGPLHLVGTLQAVQSQGGFHSISGLLLTVVGLGELTGSVGLVLDAAFVCCLGWLLWRVWKSDLDWINGAGWATVALLVTAGLLLPWYVGWLLPLAALSTDRRLLVTSVLLTGVGLTTI
jgi:alpha-1,6-mannosyltransferase